MKIGKLILMVCCLAIAFSAGLFATRFISKSDRANDNNAAVSQAVQQTESQNDLPVYWKAATFSFKDQNDQQLSDKDLLGHVWVANFIFTQCTSICPTMTAKMVLLQRRVDDPNVRFITFSVDPQHDTPAVLKQYQNLWNANENRWHLLSTDQQSLERVADEMKVTVRATDDKDNPIMHSNLFMLVDAQGQVRGVYNSGDNETMDRLAAHAAQLAAGVAKSTPGLTAMSNLDGAGIYAAMGCAACHNNPHLAPSLNGIAGKQIQLDGGMALADDAYIRESITDPSAKIVAGYHPTMPNYQGYLNAAQVQLLVDYVKSLKGEFLMSTTAPGTAVDPVCGMPLTVLGDTKHTEFGGKTYFFCSDDCMQKFLKNPRSYAKDQPK